MSRHRSIVSDRTKYEIARELGFADKLEIRNGSVDYGNITTREAGMIVRRLIEKAEEAMSQGPSQQSGL
jgi:small acid-soluble spore protein F (minor alpha/beta-type SASP)